MAKKLFDPQSTRDILLGVTGVGYEWQLRRNFDKSKECGGLASSAFADLSVAIECILVGFDDPATRLLNKARVWVQAAISRDERPQRYFPNGTEAFRYHTLAICTWLLENRHDTDSFQRFLVHEDRYLADPSAGQDKVEVSFTLPTYIDANAYEKALGIFENCRKLNPPKSLGSIRNEAHMSYVLAQHRIASEYAEDDVARAVDKFLAKNMDKWLGDGHSVRAAEWMKIAYWNDNKSKLSAKEAVLKCYAHLPYCEPPSN